MITSMTGFGRGYARLKDVEIHVEIRSLNNRFLDINVRIPKRYQMLEDLIMEATKQKLQRGKVDISVYIQESNSHLLSYKLNTPAVQAYFYLLSQIKKTVPIDQNPGFQDLLHFDDIYITEENPVWIKRVRNTLKRAVKTALTELRKDQKTEGAFLNKDIQKRVNAIGKAVRKIESLAPKRLPAYRRQMQNRVKLLVDNPQKISQDRIEQEIAILADKMDITEECIRLHSHVQLFQQTLQRQEAIGKKLDFILQEMNRESNTIGAKSNYSPISRCVVEIKDEIERIKEQVRNII